MDSSSLRMKFHLRFLCLFVCSLTLGIIAVNTNSTGELLARAKRLEEYHDNLYRRKLDAAVVAGYNISKYPYDHWKHHMHNSSRHQLWKHLETVDGFKNEDMAIVVMSTSTNHESYFRDRIIPSTRTWMNFFANVFVIVEDNFHTRLLMRQCNVAEYEHFTAFYCPHEATYVLTRKCSNDYYGAAGPCCKMDEFVNYLFENSNLMSHLKYLIHCDDDTFFRPDQVLRWLAAVDKSSAANLPLVGNAERSDDNVIQNKGVWHIKECKEIHGGGWYQPLFLNHLALKRMRAASASYGIKDTCSTFDVTLDVGFSPYAWLMQLYHIHMPGTEVNPGHKGKGIFQPDQMVVHYIKHENEDDCEGIKWDEKDRYNQDLAIGCGSLGKAGPFHNPTKRADMYDAWIYFADEGKDLDFKVGKNDFIEDYNSKGNPMPRYGFLSGYNETEHGKKNDLTKKWEQFKLSDCKPKGSIDKRR